MYFKFSVDSGRRDGADESNETIWMRFAAVKVQVEENKNPCVTFSSKEVHEGTEAFEMPLWHRFGKRFTNRSPDGSYLTGTKGSFFSLSFFFYQ